MTPEIAVTLLFSLGAAGLILGLQDAMHARMRRRFREESLSREEKGND